MEFSYFPEMYQDELLYSACARYQRNIGSKVQNLIFKIYLAFVLAVQLQTSQVIFLTFVTS